MDSPGLEKEQTLRNGGFSDEEIDAWKSDTSQTLQQGGFSSQEVKDYFGVKDPDTKAMRNYVQKNVDKYESERKARNEGKPPEKHEAHDFFEALDAGWQNSVTGLGLRGQAPETILPENAGRAMRIASQITQLAGDLPAMAAGSFFGGAAGAAVGGAAGTTVAPGVGTLGGIAIGSAVGGTAGAFALPAALRKIMMDHYEKGDITDASDFMDRLSSTTWEAIKQGSVGALTGGVGKAASVAGPIAQFGSELATMTTAGAAMEGHLPSANDFIDGAIVLGGVHAVTTLPGKLRSIYANTGERPEVVLQRVQEGDVQLKQELLSENPDQPIQAAPPEVEKVEAKPDQSNLSESEQKVLSRIGEQPEAPKASFKDNLESEYAKTFDYTFSIGKALENAEALPTNAEDNAQILSRLHAAHQDTVRSFVEFGTRDFESGKKNGEALQPIINDYQKEFPDDGGLNKLKAYGMAERALEKEGQGVKTGIDLEAAQKVVDENRKQLKPYFDRMVSYNNRVLDYMHDSGYFSPVQVKAMKELNKSYFPFYRLQEIDELTGKGKNAFASSVKKMFGSESQIVDPILSTIKNTEMMLRLAETNRIRKTFVDQISTSEHMEDFLREVKPDKQKIFISGEELNTQLRKQDINLTDVDGINIFRNKQSHLTDTQFEVHIDGERKVFEAPAGVVDSLKRLDGDKTAMGAWTGLLRHFSQGLRIGTVNNPAFAFRHFWRNQISAPIYSKTGLRPFIDAALHSPAFFMKDEQYQNWLYNGGGISEINRLDKSYVESKIYDLNKEAPFLDKTWNVVKSGAAFSHWFITTTDNMARFAEYNRSLAQGASETQAAYNAREVIPDYQRAGLQRSFLRTTAAFLNVHLQSEDRMIRALKDDPAGTIAKALAYITLPSVLLAAANHGDDRIDDQPNWIKDLYWTTAVDHWRKGTVAEAGGIPEKLRRQDDKGNWEINDGVVIRIPKPFTLGIAFGSSFEAALSAYEKKDPRAVKDWAKSVGSSMVAEPIPNAFGPAIEQMTNYSFFRGQPVVTAQKEKLLPEMQYDQYTSESAKALGKLISYVPLVRDIGPGTHTLASPMVIENYIHGWSGTLGHYALNMMDKSLAAAGIVDAKVEPLSTLADDPFIKEFIARYPSAKTQNVIDFEHRYQHADAVFLSIRQKAREGDFEGAMALQSRYQGNMDRLRGVEVAMRNLTAGLSKVKIDPSKSPTEKRQLMDSMMYQMTSIAKMGNKMMDEFERPKQTNTSDGAGKSGGN